MVIRSPAAAVQDVVGGGIADVLEGPVGVLGGIGHWGRSGTGISAGGTSMIEFVIHKGGCAIFRFGYVLCQRIGRAGGRHIGVVSSGYVALADLLLLLPPGRPGAAHMKSDEAGFVCFALRFVSRALPSVPKSEKSELKRD